MTKVRAKRFPDEQDTILVLFVLALSFFVLRSGGWQGERKPVVAPIGSSAAMDGLWRDSVAPLKKQDMRPPADPDMLWDEPRYEQPIQKRQAPPPPTATRQQATPQPEPYFPKPRRVRKTVERQTLAPKRISFAEQSTSARTKAFLKKPEDEKNSR